MQVRALIGVRAVNRLGAFTLPFIALLVGEGQVATTLLVFGVATFVSRWLGAWLLDYLPVRAVVLVGLSACAASLLWLAGSDTTLMRYAAVAAVGLAFEIYEPATTEWIARVTDGPARAAAYTGLGAALAIAGGAAGLLAAVLLPYGVEVLITADAITCAVAALVTAAVLTDPPVGPRRHDTERGSGRRLWRNPALLRLTGAHVGFATGYLGVLALLPLLLLGKGAPEWVPGLVLGAMAVLALVARWLPSQWPHRGVLVLGMAVLGVCTAAMVGLPWTWALAPAAVFAVVDVALMGRWSALVADVAPESQRPRWFAFHGSAWAVAGVALAGLTALGEAATGEPAAGGLLLAAVAFGLGALALVGGGSLAGRAGRLTPHTSNRSGALPR